MRNPAQTRRQFLLRASATSACTFFPLITPRAQGRRVDRVGLQLYTLRQEMANDFEGTLETVAELGYKEMQFAGYYGRSPQQVRDLLQQLGLSSPAAHVPLGLIREDLEKQIDIAKEIGQNYIVVPSVPQDERTLAHFQDHAKALNEAGQRCKEVGLNIAYHNHSFEFESQGGRTGYDELLELTDPDLVSFELDLYWAVNVNKNPIALFNDNPGRFPMVHVKDRNSAGEMTEVGKGQIDFAEIFSHSDIAGIQHYFVEHDFPEDGLDSVAYSINTLKNIYF